jgi:hypothetical protein
VTIDLYIAKIAGKSRRVVMLLHDWISSFTDLLSRKPVSLSSVGNLRRRNRRQSRRSAQQYATASQLEALEDRVLLAATNPFDLGSLDGTNGFRLNGIDSSDQSGISVSDAGDVNGDGFDDVIIGTLISSPEPGESYVVFGGAESFTSSIDLRDLDGTNGFRIDGVAPGDYAGRSVSSAGDVNGDSFDDLIIGATGASPGGASYVVFGQSDGFAPTLSLSSLDGTNGFRIDGIGEFGVSGEAASSAGDVNGDGIDDLIIGNSRADPGGRTSAGEAYVVFGKSAGFGSAIELSSLDGTSGFRLNGIDESDLLGRSVSTAGDFNGDGFADLIVGASRAESGESDSREGESYVVFGKSSGFVSSFDLSSLDESSGFRIGGINPEDASGGAVSTAGDLNGDGFDDIVVGAVAADPFFRRAAGESYVIFGRSAGFAAPFDLATLDGNT